MNYLFHFILLFIYNLLENYICCANGWIYDEIDISFNHFVMCSLQKIIILNYEKDL